MTREDIECIIKWFSHIEQLATDGKTANGFPIPTDEILATIKVIAKDSREYIEKFCSDSVPNNLEEAADKYAEKLTSEPYLQVVHKTDFIAGAKWQEEMEKEYSPWLAIPELKEAALEFGEQAKDYEIGGQSFSEDMAIAFTRGAEWQKEQMMKEAIPCNVFWHDGPLLDYTQEQQDDALEKIGAHVGDKVRIIIVKED